MNPDAPAIQRACPCRNAAPRLDRAACAHRASTLRGVRWLFAKNVSADGSLTAGHALADYPGSGIPLHLPDCSKRHGAAHHPDDRTATRFTDPFFVAGCSHTEMVLRILLLEYEKSPNTAHLLPLSAWWRSLRNTGRLQQFITAIHLLPVACHYPELVRGQSA